jgi:hypothetical protein
VVAARPHTLRGRTQPTKALGSLTSGRFPQLARRNALHPSKSNWVGLTRSLITCVIVLNHSLDGLRFVLADFAFGQSTGCSGNASGNARRRHGYCVATRRARVQVSAAQRLPSVGLIHLAASPCRQFARVARSNGRCSRSIGSRRNRDCGRWRAPARSSTPLVRFPVQLGPRRAGQWMRLSHGDDWHS